MKLFFACILLSMQQISAASLELRVQDAYGHHTNKIVMGQPLAISVMIKGTDGNDLQPIIRTTPTVALQRAGQNTFALGRDTVAIQYVYRSRIDEPGTYTIGPATIVYQGNTITSNAVTLHVTDQPLDVGNGRDEKPEVFFELTTDVRTAVIGQKIPITLTFYYRDKSTRVINVLQPSSQQFVLKGDEASTFSTQELRGVHYNAIRWDWYIIPQHVGRIVIPAHSVDYEIEKKAAGRFGAFSFFFDSGYESKRVYSNAVTLTVDPLPAHRGPVLAVGRFESAKLTLEPSVAQEGQAMLLNLDITGDTEWEAVKSPELVGVPDGLRCYDSKQYMLKNNASTSSLTKRFEYVVQGLKPGRWHIPPQEFTIFDVSARKYKTLRTASVTVTIAKNNSPLPEVNSDKKITPVAEVFNGPEVAQDDLLPINQQGPWSSIPGRTPIPTWLFIILVLLPFVFVGVQQGYDTWRGYRISRATQQRSRTAFATARLAIQQAKKQNDVRALYYIFIQLFADYYCLDRGQVSQAFIEQKLSVSAVSDHIRATWHEFFVSLSSHVFSKHNNFMAQHLFTSATAWVDLWEKLL